MDYKKIIEKMYAKERWQPLQDHYRESNKGQRLSKISPSKITFDDLSRNGWIAQPIFNELFKNSNNKEIAELKCIQPAEEKNFQNDPWTYKINKYNFRDEWNFDDTRKRIGFFGCSITAGEGLNTPDTWWHQVGTALDLNIMNFGVGGAGIERIARTYSMINNLIDFDYAVILLPNISRILYAVPDENYDMSPVNFVPRYTHAHFSKVYNKFYKAYDNNKFFDSAISNINWILDNSKDKKIILASWCPDTLYAISECSTAPYLPVPFAYLGDLARDELHPGVVSNREFARVLLDYIDETDWIDKQC